MYEWRSLEATVRERLKARGIHRDILRREEGGGR